MSAQLTIHRAGPAITVQDMGRSGLIDAGISRGGAADRKAVAEGAALLGQGADLPVLEMMGMGGEFEADQDCRIALTGAPMRASIDGNQITWNASHKLPAGARLSIGAALQGTYGYLHLGGGLDTPKQLGSHATHMSAGIGKPLEAGDVIDLPEDTGKQYGDYLEADDRFLGGAIRVVPSFQTHLFAKSEVERFQATSLKRDARANRMGVKLNPVGKGFQAEGGKSVLSEAIIPGDIQITGDGTPFVLTAECQTIGGYPRIGTVLPCDLPKVVQAPAGAELRFQFIDLEDAVALEKQDAELRATYGQLKKPLIRDPHKMTDLLSYNLISGMIAGDEYD